MSTIEKNGELTYVDENGNEYVLRPKTKIECVDGLEAQLASKRPNTWTPTASEVGARPNTWMPTASDVGAAKSSHNHAASNITSGTLSTDRLPTVPFEKGGLGGTDRLSSAKKLTNESIASPNYVVSLTTSWANFGYTTIAQLRNTLGIKDYVTAQSISTSTATWSWRKWNSGFAEAWITVPQQASRWDAWGGIYLAQPDVGGTKLPFTMTQAMPFVTAHNAGGSSLGVILASDISSTNLNTFTAFRGTAGTVGASIVYNVYVTGRWK